MSAARRYPLRGLYVVFVLIVPVLLLGCPPHQPPLAEFLGAPQMGSAPLRVQFQDFSLPGGQALYRWEWDFGDGGVSSEQHPVHVYGNPGSYNVTLRVFSAAGGSEEYKRNYVQVSASGVTQFRIACVNAGPYPVSGVYVVPVDAGSLGRNLLSEPLSPGTTRIIAMDFGPNLYIAAVVFDVDGARESVVLPGNLNALAMMASALTLELSSEGPGAHDITAYWGWGD